MMGSPPDVEILNFDSSMTVSCQFPLIYVHGIVKNWDCKNSKGTIACHNARHGNKIHVWPVVDGIFKVFCFVKDGFNAVELHYDSCTVANMQVLYKKPRRARHVWPIYVVCKSSNGEFHAPAGVPNSVEFALERIRFNVRLLQTFTAEALYEHGFPRKTFTLLEDEDGDVLVKVFYSDLDQQDALAMTNDGLYQYFNAELNKAFSLNPHRKFLVFMSCTRYCPPFGSEFDPSKTALYLKGHAALGGNDMALFGTGCLHTWASSLEDLVGKFTDERCIDIRNMADDSCGRGTYWANYSTTLGATMHELGHCFDLAHTKSGIMARGFDDMNHFFTVVKSTKKGEVADSTLPVIEEDKSQFRKYMGAHWYRSSAVILDCHKWFQDELDEAVYKSATLVMPSQPSHVIHPDVYGPVGDCGPSKQNALSKFSLIQWLQKENVELAGFVFYWNEYLCGLQFVGVRTVGAPGQSATVAERLVSPLMGSLTESAKRTEFTVMHPEERIVKLGVRYGAWIDAIQVSTNMKSSMWLGGTGGSCVEFAAPSGRFFENVVGTAGGYVGSFGFILNRQSSSAVSAPVLETLLFRSPNGIRVIEVEDVAQCVVSRHWEYLEEEPPTEVELNIDRLLEGAESAQCLVFDKMGEKLVCTVTRSQLKELQSLL